MKNKGIYIIALLFGLLTSYFLYEFLAKVEKDTTKIEMETVVVAAQDVPTYTLLTREMVKLQKVPVGSAHPHALRQPEEAVGKITIIPLIVGEQLLQEKVAGKDNLGSGLAFKIPEGKRALSIQTSAIRGVAGFLKPGDRVDVLCVMETGETSESMVILQDIEILAAGANLDPHRESEEQDTKSENNQTLTLAVTVEEAQALFLADVRGDIRLILRGPAEEQTVEAKAFQMKDLFD